MNITIYKIKHKESSKFLPASTYSVVDYIGHSLQKAKDALILSLNDLKKYNYCPICLKYSIDKETCSQGHKIKIDINDFEIIEYNLIPRVQHVIFKDTNNKIKTIQKEY